jgi:hypothetical protein
MSRATGSIRGCHAARRPTSRAGGAAGHGRHLLFGQLARRAQGVVDGGHDQVLEHLDVGGIDRRRIDGDADQLLLAGRLRP